MSRRRRLHARTAKKATTIVEEPVVEHVVETTPAEIETPIVAKVVKTNKKTFGGKVSKIKKTK
tara:strand:- start:1156 stop:1344 length:189 start_codon:yes stop_codon:yes gene_type:complete